MKHAFGDILFKYSLIYLLLPGCTEISWHSPPPPSTIGEATYEIIYKNLERNRECREEYLAPLVSDRELVIESVDATVTPEILASLRPFLNEGMIPLVEQNAIPPLGDLTAQLLTPLIDEQTDPQLLTLTSILRLSQTRSVVQPKHFLLFVERLLDDPKLKEVLHSTASLALEHDGMDYSINEVFHLLNYHLGGLASGFQCERIAPLELEQSLLRDDLVTPEALTTSPAWLVRSDKHGNPRVALNQYGQLPPPFVDENYDGAADINHLGQPVDAEGNAIQILPLGTTGSRDNYGRALTTDGELLYDYYDTKRTGLALMLLLAHDVLASELHHPISTLIQGILGPQQPCYNEATPCRNYSTLDNPIADAVHLGIEVAKYDDAHTLLNTWSQLLNNNPELAEEVFVSLGQIIQSLENTESSVTSTDLISILLDMLPLISEIFDTPNDSGESTGRLLMGVIHELGQTARDLPEQLLTTIEYSSIQKEIACSDTPLDLNNSVPVDYSQPRYYLNPHNNLIDNRSSIEKSVELLSNVDCGSVPFTNGKSVAEFVLEYAASMEPDDTCNLIDTLLGWLGVFPSMGENLSIATLNIIGCDGALVWNDLQSLDSLAKSGALDSYLPIARVFVEREQVHTLLSIFHLLADDLRRTDLPSFNPGVVRASLPLMANIIKSGAVTGIIDLDALLVTVNASDNSGTAADVFVDSVERLVTNERRLETRLGPIENTSLARELLLTLQTTLRKIEDSRQDQALQTLVTHMTSYFRETEVDDNGTSWEWDDRTQLTHAYILPLTQMTLDFLVSLLDGADESRHCYLDQLQDSSKAYFTGSHFGALVRLLDTLRTSENARPVEGLLKRSLDPNHQSPNSDILGPLTQILSGLLQASPDDIDIKRFILYLSSIFDPDHFDGRSTLITMDTLLRHDPEDFLLSLGRNALDQGQAGVNNAPIASLAETFANIAAISEENMCQERPGLWTAREVAPLIEGTINFLTLPDSGLDAIWTLIRSRSTDPR